MRVVIIPDDGMVSVDGDGFSGLDLSFIDASVHAVQWYDTFGSIERRDAFGRIIRNDDISDLSEFQSALDAWHAAKAQVAAQAAAADAALAEEIATAEAALLSAEGQTGQNTPST